MKAIVLTAFGDSRHFEEQTLPIPEPKEGEVRIALKAAAFNPVDYKIRQGGFGGEVPLVLGGDCSGMIDALGRGVTEFSVGDPVMALCFGAASNGSYAQYLTLPAAFVSHLPSVLSYEEGAAIPIASLTAYQGLIATRALKRGDHVLILGAGGGVGSAAVGLARMHGAGKVMTVARDEASAAWLQEHLGFEQDDIVLYLGLTTEALIEALIRRHGGLFDVVYDCVGGSVKDVALGCTQWDGHCISCLPDDDAVAAERAALQFRRGLSLHSVYVGAAAHDPQLWHLLREQLEALREAYQTGALPPPVTTSLGSLSVENIQEAHRRLEEGRVKGKLVMTIGS